MSESQSKDVVEDLVLQLSEPVIKKTDGKRRALAKAKLVFYPTEKGKPPIEGMEIVMFESPIGPIEKEELKWYLERYYIWPAGPFKDRAQKTEKDLPIWGKAIYDEVFSRDSAKDVLSAWAHAAGTKRRFTVSIDSRIEGSKEKSQLEGNEAASELLSLPWELMHNGKEYMFQGTTPVQVRRQLPNTKELESIVSEPPIRWGLNGRCSIYNFSMFKIYNHIKKLNVKSTCPGHFHLYPEIKKVSLILQLNRLLKQ